jgi:hypothetical protein
VGGQRLSGQEVPVKRTVTAILLAAASLWAADNGAVSKRRNRTNEPPKTESMTGCVDQRGETYVLTGAAMKQEARLSGKAFSDDNFARYIGHTVTVHGTVDRTASPAVVQVARIEDVKQTCR